ncbi:hypothetical protein D3C86_1346280 [compost metagenome]
MAAARTFCMEGMDGATSDGGDSVFHETAFVQRIGVDHHLHVVFIGHRQAIVDGGRRRAPVLMQFQRGSAGKDHLFQRRWQRGIALAGEREIHREGIEALDHALDMPCAGAGGGERAVRRAGTATEHAGDAAHQRLFDLLRADEVNMRIHAAGGQDLAFTGNRLRRGTDDDRHARLRIRVSRLADGVNAAVLQAHIRLVDAAMVDDHHIGDDGIDRPFGPRRLTLAHAVANDLAAAEFHFLAIGRVVLLDLDEEFGIGKAHLVAHGRAKHAGIGGAGNLVRHGLRLLRTRRKSMWEKFV